MKRTIRNSYYAYKLIDPRTDQPFYVGKGYSTRLYSHKTEALKPKEGWTNPHKCYRILQILNDGADIKYEYVLCESEEAALSLEREWIVEYGISADGGILTNISASGEVAHPTCIPVDVYKVTGEFVGTFKSVNDVTRQLCVSDEGIIRRCMNDYDSLSTYKGYVFVKAGQPFSYVNNKKKVVVATNGDCVIRFNGTKAAAAHFGKSPSCVRQCCKNNWQIDGFTMSYV